MRLRIEHGETFDSKHLGHTSAAIGGPRTPHLRVSRARWADEKRRLATVEHCQKASTVLSANWNVLCVGTIVLGRPDDLAFRSSRLRKKRGTLEKEMLTESRYCNYPISEK
jgi:hypothetical protein